MSTEANPRLTLVFEVLGRGFIIQRVILIFGIESESKVNRTRLNSAQSTFFGNHPSSNNITRCQVPSRVRALES